MKRIILTFCTCIPIGLFYSYFDAMTPIDSIITSLIEFISGICLFYIAYYWYGEHFKKKKLD